MEILNGVNCHSRAYPVNEGKEYMYWFECTYCGCGYVALRGNVSRVRSLNHCGCQTKIKMSKRRPSYTPGNKLPDKVAIVNNLLYSCKVSAKVKGFSMALSKLEVTELMFKPCYWCGKPPDHHRPIGQGVWKRISDTPSHGIDRLDSSIGYESSNCVTSCTRCNFLKSDTHADDFILLISRIYHHSIKETT